MSGAEGTSAAWRGSVRGGTYFNPRDGAGTLPGHQFQSTAQNMRAGTSTVRTTKVSMSEVATSMNPHWFKTVVELRVEVTGEGRGKGAIEGEG